MQLDTGRLWYVPDLPAVELLTGRYQRQVFPWHAHAGYCLSLQEQGSETLALPGGPSLWVRPGQLLVLGPGQVHANYAHQTGQPWQLRSFYLDPAWLAAVAPAGYSAPSSSNCYSTTPCCSWPCAGRTSEGYSPATTNELSRALRRLVQQHAQPAAAQPAAAQRAAPAPLVEGPRLVQPGIDYQTPYRTYKKLLLATSLNCPA